MSAYTLYFIFGGVIMKYYVVLNRTEEDGIYNDNVVGVKITKEDALKLMQAEKKRVEKKYGEEGFEWELHENKDHIVFDMDAYYYWVDIELQIVEEV